MPKTQQKLEPVDVALLVCFGPLAATLWIGSLFARIHLHIPALHFGGESDKIGWWLLEWGWIGPLGMSIAWYANLPFIICVVQIARGRPPKFWIASIGFVLALTGLLPFYIMDFERVGYTPAIISGPALWLWLSSFAVIFGLAWLYVEAAPRRPENSSAEVRALSPLQVLEAIAFTVCGVVSIGFVSVLVVLWVQG